jgi:hypothetical protein
MGYSLNKPNLRNILIHVATCNSIIELLDTKISCINFADFSHTGIFA